MEREITVDLVGCARCDGAGHQQITFKALTHPVLRHDEPPLSYWAPCPTTGEPILMAVGHPHEFPFDQEQPAASAVWGLRVETMVGP